MRQWQSAQEGAAWCQRDQQRQQGQGHQRKGPYETGSVVSSVDDS